MKRSELDMYSINALLFMLFMLLFLTSEIIIHYLSAMAGFLLYSDWLMIFLLLLLFLKFKGKILNRTRNFFIALMALPVLRIVTFSFPFSGIGYLYETIIIYAFLLIMSLIYIKNLNIDKRLIFKFRALGYVPVLTLVSISFSFLLYSISKPAFPLNIAQVWYHYVFIVVAVMMIAGANALYYRGVLQYLLERVLDPKRSIILIAFLSIIPLVGFGSIFAMIAMFVFSYFLGMVFHETKSVFLLFVLELVFTLGYQVIFPILM